MQQIWGSRSTLRGADLELDTLHVQATRLSPVLARDLSLRVEPLGVLPAEIPINATNGPEWELVRSVDRFLLWAVLGAVPLFVLSVILPSVRLSDGGLPGWDQLPDHLATVLLGWALTILFLLVSIIAGLFAAKRRKIVLFWTLPSGMALCIVFGYLAALVGGVFWQAGWM